MLSNWGRQGFHGGEYECSDGGEEGASGCQEGVEKIVSRASLATKEQASGPCHRLVQVESRPLACPSEDV